MMGILGWAIFGLIVGALAKLVMPGRDPGGIIVTMLLGVVGAVVAGYLGQALRSVQPQRAGGFLHVPAGCHGAALRLPAGDQEVDGLRGTWWGVGAWGERRGRGRCPCFVPTPLHPYTPTPPYLYTHLT